MARFDGRLIDYVVSDGIAICTACKMQVTVDELAVVEHTQGCPGFTREALLYEVDVASLTLKSKQGVVRCGRWGL